MFKASSTLWVTTQTRTASFNGGTFGIPITTPEAFLSLIEYQGEMIGASENALYRLRDGAWVSTGVGQPGISALANVSLDGDPVLAVGIADQTERAGGIRFFDGVDFSPSIAPRGIGGNTVQTVEYDMLGNLWVGTSGSRMGVSKFTDEEWTAFTRSDTLYRATTGCFHAKILCGR